jgi:hypothetical protein
MAESDKKTRDVSIPFTAYLFNDIFDLNGTAYNYNLIRFVKPGNMELTECYALIKITAPSAQNLDFFIAIGEWDTGATTLYKAKSGSTSEYILKSHRKLTGTNNKFHVGAGATELFEVNLMRDMPVAGESNYKKDGFILLFDYDVDPDTSASGSIEINITGSVLLGVL